MLLQIAAAIVYFIHIHFIHSPCCLERRTPDCRPRSSLQLKKQRNNFSNRESRCSFLRAQVSSRYSASLVHETNNKFSAHSQTVRQSLRSANEP